MPRRRRGTKYERGGDAATIRNIRRMIRQGDCYGAEVFLRNYPPRNISSAGMRRLVGAVHRCVRKPPPDSWLPRPIYR